MNSSLDFSSKPLYPAETGTSKNYSVHPRLRTNRSSSFQPKMLRASPAATPAGLLAQMPPSNSGAPQFSLFTDSGVAYTGAIDASGSQQTGLAARISVNMSLVSDPAQLVAYGPGTASGDTTRPDFIVSQLTNASMYYSPQTGVGTASSPYKGTLLNYTQQFLTTQGNAAVTAQQIADGQNVVLNMLQQKMDSTSGVNIDDEMAHLLALQNAYSANARVMSVVNDMYKSLMQAI